MYKFYNRTGVTRSFPSHKGSRLTLRNGEFTTDQWYERFSYPVDGKPKGMRALCAVPVEGTSEAPTIKKSKSPKTPSKLSESPAIPTECLTSCEISCMSVAETLPPEPEIVKEKEVVTIGEVEFTSVAESKKGANEPAISQSTDQPIYRPLSKDTLDLIDRTAKSADKPRLAAQILQKIVDKFNLAATSVIVNEHYVEAKVKGVTTYYSGLELGWYTTSKAAMTRHINSYLRKTSN